MATTLVIEKDLRSQAPSAHLNAFERYIVRRAHPASLFVEVVGLTWFVYFFAQHLWREAILSVIIARILGQIVVKDANTNDLAQTTIGKIALLHLDPVNMTVQLAGFVWWALGVWQGDLRQILAGMSLIFLGHLRGWGGVMKNFKLGSNRG
jgi:hypothetical protein